MEIEEAMEAVASTETKETDAKETDGGAIAFRYGGRSYLIEKDATGRLTIFRKTRQGVITLQGQQAYQVAKAYKLKVEQTPSLRKPRAFAKKARKKW